MALLFIQPFIDAGMQPHASIVTTTTGLHYLTASIYK